MSFLKISGQSTTARGVLRTGGVWFLFFGGILLVLAELSFWRGDWALAYHSIEFRYFSDIS